MFVELRTRMLPMALPAPLPAAPARPRVRRLVIFTGKLA
jgi:hypothetical protein